MSNILTTSFSVSANYQNVGFAIAPSTSQTTPSITGTPTDYFAYGGSAVSVVSGAYTVPSATNQVLIIVLFNFYDVNASGVTFGSAPLTLGTQGAGSQSIRYGVFYLVNPTASTDTVTATWPISSNDAKVISIFTFQNTNQTTPITDYTLDDGVNTSTTITINPTVNYSLLESTIFSYKVNVPHTHTTGGGQSELLNFSPAVNTRNSSSTKSADVALEVNVSNALTITENKTITNSQLGGVSVFDTVTITESVTSITTLAAISTSQILTITENVALFPPTIGFSPSIPEVVSITESVTVVLASGVLSVNTTTVITISENVSISSVDINIYLSGIVDLLSISESITMDSFRISATGMSLPGSRKISL